MYIVHTICSSKASLFTCNIDDYVQSVSYTTPNLTTLLISLTVRAAYPLRYATRVICKSLHCYPHDVCGILYRNTFFGHYGASWRCCPRRGDGDLLDSSDSMLNGLGRRALATTPTGSSGSSTVAGVGRGRQGRPRRTGLRSPCRACRPLLRRSSWLPGDPGDAGLRREAGRAGLRGLRGLRGESLLT